MAEAGDGAAEKAEALKKLKQIDVEEFKKHSSPKNLWICIHGKVRPAPRTGRPAEQVLDVTSYQGDHPGMDASQDFVDVGHTPEAKSIMEGLVIGAIPEEQLKTLEGYVEGLEDEEASEGGGANMLLILALLAIVAGVAYKMLA